MTDPSFTNQPVENSTDTREGQNCDETDELLQASGTNNQTYPAQDVQQIVGPNIDMFMACCDWEAAIQEERESDQNDEYSQNIMQTDINGTST